MNSLLSVNLTYWKAETNSIHQFLNSFGSKLPKFILPYLNTLEDGFNLGHNTPMTTNRKLLQWVGKFNKNR